ncbi:unnamed protein product [Triticum turgidum subsp. durum]|uniref:F-box associated domain-containing protein n=1 Tax=Triticum turgidum subsp. durum TaxID=4567 RepID=A0A9R0RYF6_TRITD|nr:unnamed protein product [Triticum turgidum subsp. durum]
MLVEPKTDYVVCNPAAEKWVTVPATEWSSKVDDVRLGFDSAVSSHFHVFELVPTLSLDVNKGYDDSIEEVGIYSSEARDWTHQIEWDYPFVIGNFSGSAFLSGVLYLPSGHDSVAAINVEGNCRIISVPTSHDGGPDVYVSRGQLYLTIQGASELSIWVLTDSSSENCWTLKLNGSYLQLFGIEYSSSKHRVISAQPEHDVIFIAVESESGYLSLVKLCSYEMDSGELRVICDLGWNSSCPYLPYVPLFSESLADGH